MVSTSVQVTFWKPISASIGESIAGSIIIKIPCTIHPITTPLRPPILFAKIPAVPPAKKLLITPGTTNAPKYGEINIPIKDPIVVKMKPKITAFGAYGNNTGQSSAGFEFGTSFMEIPWNAGTISASSILTPVINTYSPTTNCIACKKAYTI